MMISNAQPKAQLDASPQLVEVPSAYEIDACAHTGPRQSVNASATSTGHSSNQGPSAALTSSVEDMQQERNATQATTESDRVTEEQERDNLQRVPSFADTISSHGSSDPSHYIKKHVRTIVPAGLSPQDHSLGGGMLSDGKPLAAGSFSWRHISGGHSGSGVAPTPLINNNNNSNTSRVLSPSLLRNVYFLLSEYRSSLPSGALGASLTPLLTLLLMDTDVVSSLDMHNGSAAFKSTEISPTSLASRAILHSPRNEAFGREKRRIMTESRPEFENMSSEGLLQYAMQAHSSLILLSEIIMTTSEAASDPIASGASCFGAAMHQRQQQQQQQQQQQHISPRHTNSGRVRFARGAASRPGVTESYATASSHVPSFAIPEGGANAPNLAMSSMALSVNNMVSPYMLQSVASMCLAEPIHETDVANRSKDELGVKMLNNYILMDTLGQGACGKVKLGYDIDKGQSVAIKVVRRGRGGHFNGSSSGSKIEALQREIAVMKKLRHKNIVSLYEVIDDPEAEKLYLVMQFVDEGPIAKMNSDGSCPTRPAAEVAMYARQVCAGLEYLHSHGVVHRDIKPENILVSSTKQAFLADFGVSEVFGAQEAREVRGHKGTPMFMAPEMWHHGASNLAESSSHHEINDDEGALEGFALDVWALGVTFYMLLVGKPPFANLEQTMSRAELPPLTFPEAANVPAEWMSILRRMLDPKPYKRPQASVIRAHIKKLEKTLNPPPAIPAKHSSRGKGGMVVHVDDVATAFTPRYATSGPRPSVGFTSPTVSPANASRRSVAVGRGTFLHVPTARAASMGSNGFTPVVQSLTAPNLSSPTGSAEPPPDDSRGSISPNPMTHTVFVEREGGPPRVRFEDEYIPPPALSPAPPATQRPDTASPKLLKQAVPSCQEEVPEARRDGDTPDGTTTLGNSDGTFRDGSILQSTSTAGDLRVITFTNSRGEYQPAIVVHDADMFE